MNRYNKSTYGSCKQAVETMKESKGKSRSKKHSFRSVDAFDELISSDIAEFCELEYRSVGISQTEMQRENIMERKKEKRMNLIMEISRKISKGVSCT